MEPLKLTPEEFEWIAANSNLFTRSLSPQDGTRQEVFRLYNKITGLNKKPTSCGRCWRNTKKTVYDYYEKIIKII